MLNGWENYMSQIWCHYSFHEICILHVPSCLCCHPCGPPENIILLVSRRNISLKSEPGSLSLPGQLFNNLEVAFVMCGEMETALSTGEGGACSFDLCLLLMGILHICCDWKTCQLVWMTTALLSLCSCPHPCWQTHAVNHPFSRMAPSISIHVQS